MADTFSNLPNEIAHHVLSFLSLKDLIRVGSVSKRCLGFYLSTPSLNFNDFPVDNFLCDSRKGVLDSIDRFLTQRGDNKILCFRFSWPSHLLFYYNDDDEDGRGFDVIPCSCNDEIFRLYEWIENAVRCNVEVVDLVITSSIGFPKLPTSLFVCPSLRFLSVDIGKCVISDVPASDALSNLEYIKLKNAIIIGEGFWKWISHCCKFIREFHLEDVSGFQNVNIEISSLESFSFVFRDSNDSRCCFNISGDRIEKMRICLVGSNKKCFNFSAPNIKYLQWSETFYKHRNLGKFMCLERGEISSGSRVIDNFDVLLGFIRCIRGVKVLVLSKDIVKAFSMDWYLSLQLDSVRHLSIDTVNLKDDFVPALVSLLRGMSSLISLCIRPKLVQDCTSTNYCSGFDIKYWKVQDLSFISQIQEVSLQLYTGSNAVEFARYILEHAPNLEKMAIYHFSGQLDAVMQFKSKLNSNAVYFHEVNNILQVVAR